MFFITLLDQLYWICGALTGSLLGSIIHFNTKGIEFVMTALFVVMFIDKLEKERNYISAAIGIAASVLALIILGPSNYLLMAIIIIIICFFYLYRRELYKLISLKVLLPLPLYRLEPSSPGFCLL